MQAHETTKLRALMTEETMDADRTSAWFDLNGAHDFYLECFTSGGTTHSGNIIVQGSLTGDKVSPIATIAVASGAALEHGEDVVNTAVKYVRVFWDRTAGVVTELLTVIIHPKKRAAR